MALMLPSHVHLRGQTAGLSISTPALEVESATEHGQQLVLLTEELPQRLFGGGKRSISTTWHNPGASIFRARLHSELYQANSSTAAPLRFTPWKDLEILPGQTILESATLDFPAVRAESHFLVRWVQGSNEVLGTTLVSAYPTNLLAQLNDLLNRGSLGLYDPQGQLRPLLKSVGVAFSDLESASLEHFPGSLAVVGPFGSMTQVPGWVRRSVRALASKGTGVILVLPFEPGGGHIKPSFYTVFEGNGAVVVAQPVLLSNVAQSPQAQLNLIELCRRALNPEPPGLPLLSSEP